MIVAVVSGEPRPGLRRVPLGTIGASENIGRATEERDEHLTVGIRSSSLERVGRSRRRGALGDMVGVPILIILEIQQVADANLPDVAQALDSLGGGFGPGQRGQEHSGEDRDDRDDDQKLNEGEGRPIGTAEGRGTRDCRRHGLWISWMMPPGVRSVSGSW